MRHPLVHKLDTYTKIIYIYITPSQPETKYVV